MNERIEPREVHQPKRGFERTGPVDAAPHGVAFHPVLQPNLRRARGVVVLVQPRVHHHARHLAPAIDLPDCTAVSATGHLTMIDPGAIPSDRSIDIAEEVAIPRWRGPDRCVKPAKQAKFPRRDLRYIRRDLGPEDRWTMILAGE